MTSMQTAVRLVGVVDKIHRVLAILGILLSDANDSGTPLSLRSRWTAESATRVGAPC